MLLSTLLHDLDATVVRSADDVTVTRVTLDSRKVEPGTVFVAARGVTPTSNDGHRFIANAVALGASAVVLERGREDELEGVAVPDGVSVFAVAAPRVVAAEMAERLYGRPSKTLKMIGVTGTNGKTTSTFVLAQALAASGHDAAVFGTLGVGRPETREVLGFTTPEAEVISERLAKLVADGVQTVAMEVSSHALATARSEAIHFSVAAFTNLTQDHLDFHQTMDAYLAAKARLFTALLPAGATAVLPAHLPEVTKACAVPANRKTLTWAPDTADAGLAPDVTASSVEMTTAGLSFVLHAGDERHHIVSPLVGRFNLENLLVAAASMLAIGIPFDDVAKGLSAATGVPGRMQRVGHAPLVVVDYAHTPDALTRALTCMRELCTGRLFVVFGAGGDRDATKRAPMGQAAASHADAVVLTSDNPRHEDPEAILDALEDGVRAAGMTSMQDGLGFCRVTERAEAIGVALAMATEEDAVLIAGKGAERTQTIGDEKRPFDDVEVVGRVLEEGV